MRKPLTECSVQLRSGPNPVELPRSSEVISPMQTHTAPAFMHLLYPECDSGSTRVTPHIPSMGDCVTPATGGEIALEPQPSDALAVEALTQLLKPRELSETAEEDDYFNVATYFLSPHNCMTCAFARLVQLRTDPSSWREAFLKAWTGMLQATAPAEIFVALPPPHQNLANQVQMSAFVLIVQGRSSALCPVLYTIHEGQDFTRIAQLVFPEVRRRQVLMALGLGRRCFGATPRFDGVVLRGLHAIGQDQSYTLHPGASVLVQINPIPLELQSAYADSIRLERQQVPEHDPLRQVLLEAEWPENGFAS